MKTQSYDRMFLRPWERNGIKHSTITKAQGLYVTTSDGKKYVDLTSGLFNIPFGHAPNDIIAAITQQLRTVDYVGPIYATESRSLACQSLYQATRKKFHSFFFAPGGAEAIEGAMKFARHTTQRIKLVAAQNSYHGSTYGAHALSGDPDRKRIIGSPEGVVHFNSTDHYLRKGIDPEKATQKAVESLQKVVRNSAAVFLEPFTGVNSFYDSPREYLKEVQAICYENDSLLIFDEILTGFGRTGDMFAFERHRVTPDIICIGKNLTAGLIPQGAAGLSKKTAKRVHENPIPFGHTYMGHPAACAATVAVIQKMKKERVLSNVQKQGKYLFNQLAKTYPSIRGRGLLMVIPTQTDELFQKLKRNGMLSHVENGNLPIAPPLTIQKKDSQIIIKKFEK